MRVTKGLFFGVVATGLGLACLWPFGCDDGPTKPPPVEANDYPVYFCNSVNSTLWIFHPLTLELDSMVVPYEGEMRSVTVSADGKQLYFTQRDRVLVLTADSLQLVAELPYGAWFGAAVSPDDRLLAIMGQDFYVLNTTDWSVVFSDTTRLHDGIFSSDSRTFYAGHVDGGEFYNSVAWVRPLDPDAQLQRYQLPGPPMQIIPTPSNRKLLAYLLHRFVVYDINLDSVTHETVLWPGAGYLAMAPEGKLAFFSNPSTPHGELGTNELYVFDVRANYVCDTVRIDRFLDSLTWPVWGVGSMVVTPDGRWLAALNASMGPRILFLYEIRQREAVYAHEFGYNHWFGNISVQHMR
ncbi:MAG: hypothetical protein AB1772_04785 [Candidatus Zixiibacteriota bacterium]